jgi:hypothetical protein
MPTPRPRPVLRLAEWRAHLRSPRTAITTSSAGGRGRCRQGGGRSGIRGPNVRDRPRWSWGSLPAASSARQRAAVSGSAVTEIKLVGTASDGADAVRIFRSRRESAQQAILRRRDPRHPHSSARPVDRASVAKNGPCRSSARDVHSALPFSSWDWLCGQSDP